MARGHPGHLVVDDGARRLRSHITWSQTRATSRHDQGVLPRTGAQGRLDHPTLIADQGTVHREPEFDQPRRDGVARRVVANTGRRAIARREDKSGTRGPVAHQGCFRLEPMRPAVRSPGRGRGRMKAVPGSPWRSGWRSQVPLLPPVLEMSRTARISTPRSTPLTMS